ncbi:MAG: hypothetical protein FWC51_02775 [Proteobacteria bacterium]|nr:hypothetical protein [Pseudomonadota bacterium]
MKKLLMIAALAALTACVAPQQEPVGMPQQAYPAYPTTQQTYPTAQQALQAGVNQTRADLQNNMNQTLTNMAVSAATGTAPAAVTTIDPYVNKAAQVINTYETAKAIMAQ